MLIAVNGTHLWFDVDGPGLVPESNQMVSRPTVVLLHGGPGSLNHSYFKPDFAELAAVAQVVYLDLRDHGRSDRGDPQEWTFETAADDVAAFCETLDIASPIVLGHSMGGVVAMLYAARHPHQPAGLILQSTVARFDLNWVVERFRELGSDEIADIARREYGGDRIITPEAWAKCWKVFGLWVPGREEVARIPRNDQFNDVWGPRLQDIDVLDQLASIICPTLISVGEIDPIHPVRSAREALEATSAAPVHLDVIPDAGAFPWRDAPDHYWPVLKGFIRRVSDELEL